MKNERKNPVQSFYVIYRSGVPLKVAIAEQHSWKPLSLFIKNSYLAKT